MNPLLETTIDLVRMQTVRTNAEELARAIVYCRQFFAGFPFMEWTVNGVTSLLVGKANARLVLHGHLDVVPAPAALFEPRLEGEKLFGRGTNDMKGAVAVLMHALRDGNYDHVSLLLTTDEEVGGMNGAGVVAEELKLEFFLSGEPTRLQVGNRAKGVLHVDVRFTGKSAHASTPWQGESAIAKAAVFVNALGTLFLQHGDYYTTCNVGKINGGDAYNKVADACTVSLDIRHVPSDDPDTIIAKLAQYGAVSVIARGSCAFCPEDEQHVQLLMKALAQESIPPKLIAKHGASDARFFTEHGIPAVVFGPLGDGSHAPDEHVIVKSLEQYYRVIKRFCELTK
ncbi:M20/M25/M40 family metallo-hydrolase [Candidatus Woesearchaeota archaeon]|nr:M20/M25/M40 family metallo-hydrolase [Candidatus Woesearchaeota archaeon]